ncbi:Rod binding protein [Devosia enhydra]|uniref:Rod binding protein n=1 Tax=Devosia enhydra TaxID=665118 RepID=A0A1K2HTU4_9HYPH|nr:rod-binding protein [Devosia enhydra]SFZ81491.1 Rod binding protein [Devosia enhydra]
MATTPLGPAALSAYSPAAITRARQQAEELEGVFLQTLVKEMFATTQQSGETGFGGGFAEETWRGLQAEEMAGAMARAGGIGLADQIVADLLFVQQAAGPCPARPSA